MRIIVLIILTFVLLSITLQRDDPKKNSKKRRSKQTYENQSKKQKRYKKNQPNYQSQNNQDKYKKQIVNKKQQKKQLSIQQQRLNNQIVGPKIKDNNQQYQKNKYTLDEEIEQEQEQSEISQQDDDEQYLMQLEKSLNEQSDQTYQFEQDTKDLEQQNTQPSKSFLYSWVDYLARQFMIFIYKSKIFYKFISHKVPYRPMKINYQSNYASLNGGAKIIMKSSLKIKFLNSILDDSVDKYMYTDELLPIKFIIGLNEQIAIQSICIISFQMYSAITKQFRIQGKFSLDDKKWVALGYFTAKNQFGTQQFFTQRKIIRYIRIKITSVYGKWSYFTLTQIKIKGKSLFADALSQIGERNSKKLKQEQQHPNQHQNSNNHTDNFCDNQFKPQSKQPLQNNLIGSLMKKLENLEDRNIGEMKQMEMLEASLNNLSDQLLKKSREAEGYKQLSKRIRNENQIMLYVISIGLALSLITSISLIYLSFYRKKQSSKMHKQASQGQQLNVKKDHKQ